jgi:hypothetical protein
MTRPATLEAQPDFSLVLGGPLFQFFRRSHLSGDELELLRRRVIVISCIAWAPLLLLSAFSGHALGDRVAIPFLYDIEAHVRFLIALPMLIAAELVVHRRGRKVVGQFLERRIILPEEVPKFHEAIESTLRLRNSVVAEVAILALVYTLGIWLWRNEIALGAASWYAFPDATELHLTPAGYWYVFVSLPIFQFLLLRWYLRLVLWFWFLLRVSRLNLRLMPMHPDRTAGLGFLSGSTNAFTPFLAAQGVVLAGLAASQIFYAGHNLMAYKVEIAGYLAFFIIAMLVPLTVFIPCLARAKRQGKGDFGRLASRYVQEFEEKWIHGARPADEAILGSGDIQSLADLGNSYGVVQEMRIAPFGLKDVTRLALIGAAPFLPLTLTIFSFEELVNRLIKVIF